MSKFRVILEGFETEEDLLDWVSWFTNSDEEFFLFKDGTFPAATIAYSNMKPEIIDNTVLIPIEKVQCSD